MDNSQKIVEYLSSKEGYTKAGELSDFLGISTRQVRKYIASINKNKKYILSSGQGYRLNRSLYSEFILKQRNITSEQEYRQKYIIQKLITNPDGYDIFDLAEELYVSESSIKKDLQNVRVYLRKCHMAFTTNKNIVHLDGDEEHKRRLMHYFIQDYTFDSNLYEEHFSLFNEEYDYKLIEKTIKDILDRFDLRYNSLLLNNIAIHLIIILSRLNSGYQLDTISTSREIDTSIFYQATIEIANWCEKNYNVEFNEAELSNLHLLIANTITSSKKINYEQLTMRNIHDYVDQRFIDITKDLLKKVEDNYYLQLFKDSFITKFTLHIQNLFYRAHHNFQIKNPLASMIRTTYPLVYDIAVFITRELYVSYDIELNEDEIAFISFHIGSYFENNAFGKMARVNCLYIYNDYYDFYKNTLKKLQTRFHNTSIIEANINSDIKALVNEDIDLVILPPNCTSSFNIQTISVGFFPDQKDFNRLEHAINAIAEQKQKLELREYILNFFDESLYLKDPDYADGYIAVNAMCDHLKSLGYVDDPFKEDVLHREKIATTAFNDVAVPHTLTSVSTKKSFIYVAVFTNGIQWTDDKAVHFVAMIGINDNSRRIFTKFFDQLIKLLDNPVTLQKLINTNDFNEFYQALNSLFTS
ncbi:BglG family transcription antiterminator [Merdibacter massiliensis]|uniref:BglG family transcription antiterminator n=1 Tax=Merdibacter massiliensis TaxID=1871030 RepID=UPI00096ACAB9|nr:PTS sugar transporter subunit IIA [Merdibacter massiliensis]